MFLSGDFNKAASQLSEISRQYQDTGVNKSNLPFRLEALPVMSLSEWNDESCKLNNCYNFALNLPTDTFLKPGDIYSHRRGGPEAVKEHRTKLDKLKSLPFFCDYIDYIMEQVANDGLTFTGQELRGSVQSYPVALFFKSGVKHGRTANHDFHWFALQKQSVNDNNSHMVPVWTHKPGETPAAICSDEKNLSTVFGKARERCYDLFAGFFEVEPAKLPSAFFLKNG